MMPSKKQRITDFGEKELIKRLLKRSQNISFQSPFFDKFTFKSLSDDAALLDFGEKYLVATADLLTQTAHFPREMSYQQRGKKIVTVNVSDLAAMGATALGILVAMALPSNLTISDFDDIIDGILQACKQYNMALIGGDTNESDELTLSGTCLGTVPKKEVMMKSGAKEGDVVAVTGPLGLAAAGFEVLFAGAGEIEGLNPEIKDKVIKYSLEPEAQLEKGLKLARSGVTTSATDITDGLLSEMGELIDSSESSIGITFHEELLPIPSEVHIISELLDRDPLEMALTYGEDFELLVTIEEERFNVLKDEIGLYKIGQVTTSGQIRMVNKEGKTEILTPRGYEHLQENNF
jgi:thiamine-monophosphate kinase